MKLLRPLPPNRSYEQVLNHYLVESCIANKIKEATREERKRIYLTMYDELFLKVPDHPRLTRRASESLTNIAIQDKMAFTRNHLLPTVVFLEFAPGDCRFAVEVARHVRTAYAFDISDQRGPDKSAPANFSLHIYDGYNLPQIPANSVDIVFSDQLLEHLHPEDTLLHLKLAHSILKPEGSYLLRMPHAFTGPHDVSRYFSNSPSGFHLREWNYLEFKPLLRQAGFSRLRAMRQVGGRFRRLPYAYLEWCERLICRLPRRYKRSLARLLVASNDAGGSSNMCIQAMK